MTRGLVRKNNLSDLPSPEQSRINLGLATADLNRIRGLFSSAGVQSSEVQCLAGSLGNYQDQLNSIFASLSGITPSLYAERNGDTLTGTWTNTGAIKANSFTVSGIAPTASTDNTWTHDYQGGVFELTAPDVTMNLGVTVSGFVDKKNVVMTSGVTVNRLVPIAVDGIPYFLEAS